MSRKVYKTADTKNYLKDDVESCVVCKTLKSVSPTIHDHYVCTKHENIPGAFMKDAIAQFHETGKTKWDKK